MAQAEAKFELATSDDGYDKVLEIIGVSAEMREKSKASHPVLQLIRDGDTCTVKAHAGDQVYTTVFTLGVEKEETTPDGRLVKSVFSVEGNILKQVETNPNGKVAVYEREFNPDGMHVTATVDGVVGKRFFKRL